MSDDEADYREVGPELAKLRETAMYDALSKIEAAFREGTNERIRFVSVWLDTESGKREQIDIDLDPTERFPTDIAHDHAITLIVKRHDTEHDKPIRVALVTCRLFPEHDLSATTDSETERLGLYVEVFEEALEYRYVFACAFDTDGQLAANPEILHVLSPFW